MKKTPEQRAGDKAAKRKQVNRDNLVKHFSRQGITCYCVIAGLGPSRCGRHNPEYRKISQDETMLILELWNRSADGVMDILAWAKKYKQAAVEVDREDFQAAMDILDVQEVLDR